MSTVQSEVRYMHDGGPSSGTPSPTTAAYIRWTTIDGKVERKDFNANVEPPCDSCKHDDTHAQL